MGTPVTNFAKVTVSAGYDSDDVSIALISGHGSRLASTFPYPLSWWDATTYADPADDPNREIVIVTNRTGDTLTITRGAEGTSASTKNTGGKTYKMLAGITAAMWDTLNTLSLSQNFRGLTVRTHTDSDLAASQVRLIHADAIVMDDGQEILDWNDLDASITVSGIGGLDTGSEQASTWYQIIAAYNPGTATKGLYLHRAKDYFLDETFTAGEDATQGLRSNVDNSTVRIAQGFKVDTTGLMEMIDVKLIKVGSPTGNYWFTIEADTAGVPTNTPLATSDKYAASRVGTTAHWVRLPFRTPTTLSATTQYHLVMYGDYTVSGSNYVGWRMDGSAGTYANGSKALFDSDTSTWTTDTDDDMMFEVYITQNDSALIKPTGYTQAAMIGYVRNDGSSNFLPFIGRDRVASGSFSAPWKMGAFASGKALVNVASWIPPVPVHMMASVYNGTASNVALGTLPCTDISGTPSTEQVGKVNATVNAAWAESLSRLPIDYQALMIDTSAGTTNVYMIEFEW